MEKPLPSRTLIRSGVHTFPASPGQYRRLAKWHATAAWYRRNLFAIPALPYAWVLYATDLHDEAVRMMQKAIERKRDCEGAYYLLCRALFSAGRYQEVSDLVEIALEASGEDYNVYVPIINALGALGKKDSIARLRRWMPFAKLGKPVSRIPPGPAAILISL
jgi:tetratricopeptide (TPR) repeat protein